MPNSVENHNPKVRRRNVVITDEPMTNSPSTMEISERINETASSFGNSFEAKSNGRATSVTQHSDRDSSPNRHNVDNELTALMVNKKQDSSHQDSAEDTEIRAKRERTKIGAIRRVMGIKDPSIGELRLLGCNEDGLVDDDTRRRLWPRLLGLENDSNLVNDEQLDTVHTRVPDEVYQQILKDVARSGGHLSMDATEKELKQFQDQMTQLICWVLHRHPRLNYYQGYNDIAATVLLVMGLKQSLRILERISLDFLERFMERTMEKVNQELFYIFALLHRIHPMLLVHLENVELFPHFALAEYTTWYAHKYAENRKLLHRLFDFFLGSPPLMPLYLSTVIVAHRDTEIFNTTPDMGHTHKVLCTLPDDLPFEKLLVDAKNLYREYPPDSISDDVREFDHKRRCKEQEWKSKADACRRERERLRQLKVGVPNRTRIPYPRLRSYRTITVVTILAIGIYAFLKNGTGLN